MKATLFQDATQAKNDLLSGLTVALALIPEAIAFALVAELPIHSGLYAAFFIGLITAIAGGRPGMISGATGALAVVIAEWSQHGLGMTLSYEEKQTFVYAAIILMGVMQIVAGAAKLGKFIRLVPFPVMLGFVNGLAIVIFIAQLKQLKNYCTPEEAAAKLEKCSQWLTGEPLFIVIGIILLTMLIIEFLPRLTTIIPSALAAIIVVTILVELLGFKTLLVSKIMTFNGEAPNFAIPDVPLEWKTLKIIFALSITLAAVGLIESLLTLSLIDEMTDTHGKSNRECAGQGVANVVTGFFGGMGGCAMIGQSMININSGGRGRLSGASAALFLLVFILVAPELIGRIPVAALTGVMFIVVIKTFEWSSFRIINKIPRADAFVLIAVSAVTVYADLAIAVVTGVIISSLVFAWQHAKNIHANTRTDENGYKVYELHGPLFFGSIANFRDLFKPSTDPEHVVIEFMDTRVVDHSGVTAIDNLAERYSKLGKTLHLRHLSPECHRLLNKAGKMVEVNVMEDPSYHIASDKLD